MLKINIKPQILYWTTIAMFIAIICFFTAIYPMTTDELRLSHDTWKVVFEQLKVTAQTDASRFMNLANIVLLHFYTYWKIFFSILNPFVQLFIILGMFFVVTGRKVNFKSTKDFCLFLLLTLMYLLMVPSPSNTLFWMSGTMNYSWAFVPPLILLCLFRKSIDGKIFKDSTLNNSLMALCGFTVGMSNENTGPMMLGLTVLFLIYCKLKKIKIPKFYYFTLVGIILGITAMFGSGAGKTRMSDNVLYSAWLNLSLQEKIFVFLHHFNAFLNATFWVPIITLAGLLLTLLDKKKLIIKDKEFLLSSLFCICGFILTFVLFMAPYTSSRTHYSSAIFFFISFALVLNICNKLYRVNFIKYLSLLLLIIGIVFAPLITIPYLTLHRSDIYREQTIEYAKKRNKMIVFVNRLTVIKAPTNNWTIEYFDILWPYYTPNLVKRYNIILNYEIPLKYHPHTKPI